MRCLFPILIKGSDRRDWVPCGKCNFCLQARRADWSMRLAQELKISKTSTFLTFTYEEENLTYNAESHLPEVSKRDVQLFTKRLRKENARLVSWPLRYYLVGEYGTKTQRPHYHAIMFNVHRSIIDRISNYWTLGQCHEGEVSPASIHYVTKYHVNPAGNYPGRSPPFCLYVKETRDRVKLLVNSL